MCTASRLKVLSKNIFTLVRIETKIDLTTSVKCLFLEPVIIDRLKGVGRFWLCQGKFTRSSHRVL